MNKKYTFAAIAIAISGFAFGQAPRWRYVEVPNPSPNEKWTITDVNNRGEMSAATGPPPPFPYTVMRSGYFSASNTFVDLPLLSDGRKFVPRSISDDGRLPGFVSHLTNGWKQYGAYNTATGVYDLFAPTFGDTIFFLNTAGEAAVVSSPPNVSFEIHNLFYMNSAGQYSAIDHVTYGDLTGINDQGFISGGFGGSALTYDQVPMLVDSRRNTGRFLFSPNQEYGMAYDINEAGEVFGIVSRSGPVPGYYGVWWNTDGQILRDVFLHELSSPGSYTSLHHPYGVHMNDNGDVVYTHYGRTKFYSPLTGIIDITDVTANLPAYTKITTIKAINNSGRMVGIANQQLPNGQGQNFYNFYLEPVPEPATLAALGIGLAVVLKRRKKLQKSTRC